jgi:hypothetical protein
MLLYINHAVQYLACSLMPLCWTTTQVLLLLYYCMNVLAVVRYISLTCFIAIIINVGKDMTFRDYAQGAFRMRGIGKGQKIQVYTVYTSYIIS